MRRIFTRPNRSIIVGGAATLALSAGAAHANPGVMDTDRFGYTGTVVRYDTLADAQAGANPVDTISIGNRDIAMFIAKDDLIYDDENIALGSWWYTTDTFFGATQGRAGWGNTTGNTGVGFMQLFDSDGTTDTSVDMSFSDFDGTNYTTFNLAMTGSNATTADDFARFSAIDNVNDAGIWYDYAINLSATGLQGVDLGNGIIQATNEPTGVTGSITGLFEITEVQTSAANLGFYVVDLDLTMVNWAWDNRADLTPQISLDGGANFFNGRFDDSLFRTVPAPASLALLGLGGLVATRRRR